MDQMEKIVQLVTDRLMAQLEQDKKTPSIAFYGPKNEKVFEHYRKKGYQEMSNNLSSPDILIVTQLSLFTMTRLANLAPQDAMEEELLRRLMQREDTLILEDGLEYYQKNAQLPKLMKPLFDKAKIDLEKWGATYIKVQDFDKQAAPVNQSGIKNSSAKKKELITATRVQGLKLREGEVFVATPNMIITALAKDYLRDQGIFIEMRDA